MSKIEERQIKMPYGVESAYHCQKCGGITDEYGKCYYCHSENKIRYEPQKQLQFYIELDGEKKFYFNHIYEMDGMGLEPQSIEVTTRESNHREYIAGYQSTLDCFNFRFIPTDDSMFKVNMIQELKKPFTFNIVLRENSRVFRIRAEQLELNFSDVSQIEIFTMAANMRIHDYDGLVKADLIAPDDARCPNCGAIVHKAYGCCDYCGGWVEYR